MTPRIGDIVLYRSHGSAMFDVAPEHQPMLVTAVDGSFVSGHVFYVGGLRYHEVVLYHADESVRGTWLPKETP